MLRYRDEAGLCGCQLGSNDTINDHRKLKFKVYKVSTEGIVHRVDKLPKKLMKEPLIDAVFEIRFQSHVPASNVLPGFLFGELDGEKTIHQLPIGKIPQDIRNAESNLIFSPVFQLLWEKFVISIGDRSLVIGCKFPYPGWDVFKISILRIVEIVKRVKIIQSVQRFSMKYTDILPSGDLSEQISMINMSISIGENIEKGNFSLKVEIPDDRFIHLVSVISSAHVKLQDSSKREGIVIDIDTVSNMDAQDFNLWAEQLPKNLEIIHKANKIMFFKCLHPQTITDLEPVYD
ncbi:MAG TPA: hypothetical protein DCS88_11410 [Alphaproteobacteria bacterium]|nr:hypothetical protein [Alphaproteobacteria bacterium]